MYEFEIEGIGMPSLFGETLLHSDGVRFLVTDSAV
jgi:hypothetical protein